ncbi:hypothetical protein [Devosia nitrariae]|uniref:Uncharacterized protein n=1 Tax=Devosia nitrariae TaxID=2071872 RepID=A0ABQ5W0I3_9HYPH|nr:hypothetical protein [Devosia nitrariae]GLQ53567.1 hypothetical protein GCM10010862_08260 [Devosia nitrariae]
MTEYEIWEMWGHHCDADDMHFEEVEHAFYGLLDGTIVVIGTTKEATLACMTENFESEEGEVEIRRGTKMLRRALLRKRCGFSDYVVNAAGLLDAPPRIVEQFHVRDQILEAEIELQAKKGRLDG